MEGAVARSNKSRSWAGLLALVALAGGSPCPTVPRDVVSRISSGHNLTGSWGPTKSGVGEEVDEWRVEHGFAFVFDRQYVNRMALTVGCDNDFEGEKQGREGPGGDHHLVPGTHILCPSLEEVLALLYMEQKYKKRVGWR